MNRTTYEVMLFVAAVLLARGPALNAQSPGGDEALNYQDDILVGTIENATPNSNAVKPSEVDTLDQIRALSAKRGNFRILKQFRLEAESNDIKSLTLDARKASLKKVRELKQKLRAPDSDRKEVEAQLKDALAEYFIVDMQLRVVELDALKQKLAETEAKLQERLTERDEAVDLQLKIMAAEADGDIFFSNKRSQPSPSGLSLDASGSFQSSVSAIGMGPVLEPAQDGGSNSYSFDSDLGSGPDLGMGPEAGAATERKYQEPVAAEPEVLQQMLAKTYRLVIAHDGVRDLIMNTADPLGAHGDQFCKKLATAILRSLGPEVDPEALLWNHFSVELSVKYTPEQYRKFGTHMPAIISKLVADAKKTRSKAAEKAIDELLRGE